MNKKKQNPDPPVLVEVRRGSEIESVHRGSVVAVNAGGEVVFAAGTVSRMIYPRSALKIFQAIPLVQSGAADKFAVTTEELTLACASHNAEPVHTDAVTGWLHRLGLGVDDLECGAEPPMYAAAAHDLAARGEQPARVHHNCSGKHAGMLTLAKHFSDDHAGYSDYRHPVQQAWMQTLSELLDLDVRRLPWECDGCGLPAICMPLDLLARGYAIAGASLGESDGNFNSNGSDEKTTTAFAPAFRRLINAIRAHPHMLAGSERCDTDVIRATAGRVIIKTGAEGVYAGAIPASGIGFALKIDDGAGRGAVVATGHLLKKLGAIDNATEKQLARHFAPTILNSRGHITGKVTAAAW